MEKNNLLNKALVCPALFFVYFIEYRKIIISQRIFLVVIEGLKWYRKLWSLRIAQIRNAYSRNSLLSGCRMLWSLNGIT